MQAVWFIFFFLNTELYIIIKPEIKEIPVKSFNTQNNKKKEVINFTYLVDELLSFLKKKLEGLAEGREIVEQLSKIALPLMD